MRAARAGIRATALGLGALMLVGCAKSGPSKAKLSREAGQKAIAAGLDKLEPHIGMDKISLGLGTLQTNGVYQAVRFSSLGGKGELPADIKDWAQRWQQYANELETFADSLPEPSYGGGYRPSDNRGKSIEELRAQLEETRLKLVASMEKMVRESELLGVRSTLVNELLALAGSYQVPVPPTLADSARDLAARAKQSAENAVEARTALDGDGGLRQMAPTPAPDVIPPAPATP